MGGKRLHQRKTSSSIAMRSFGLKQMFPPTKYSLRQGRLFWKGMLQPTSLSASYEVEVTCKHNRSPDVWVCVGDVADIESIPHKYETDKANKRVKICLYLPSEYNPEWRFVTTILPWTIEWLYFFEIWTITGEWCGGGHHPK